MEQTIEKTHNQKVDAFEEALLKSELPGHKCTWRHLFTPGLYTREIFMPAGSVITSAIHKTEHPFLVSQGRVSVLTEEGEQLIEAPYLGVTKPGTRRVLVVIEDTTWTTFHPTDKHTVEEVKADIIQPYENPLLKNIQSLQIEKS